MDHPTTADVYDVDADGGLPPGGTGGIEAIAAIVMWSVATFNFDDEDVELIRKALVEREAEQQLLTAADTWCTRPGRVQARALRVAVRTWRHSRIDHTPAGTMPAVPSDGGTAACGYCGATIPRGAFHAASLRDPSQWVCDLHAEIEAEAQMLGLLDDLPAFPSVVAP